MSMFGPEGGGKWLGGKKIETGRTWVRHADVDVLEVDADRSGNCRAR